MGRGHRRGVARSGSLPTAGPGGGAGGTGGSGHGGGAGHHLVPTHAGAVDHASGVFGEEGARDGLPGALGGGAALSYLTSICQLVSYARTGLVQDFFRVSCAGAVRNVIDQWLVLSCCSVSQKASTKGPSSRNATLIATLNCMNCIGIIRNSKCGHRFSRTYTC